MTRKPLKSTPKPSETEPKSPAKSEASPKVTKSAAARLAIAEGHSRPLAAVKFIKDRFGLDMGAQHFSSVKTQDKKKSGTITIKAKGRPKKSSIEGYVAPPPKQPSASDAGLLEAMETIKPLIASLGPEKVKRIVDLLV